MLKLTVGMSMNFNILIFGIKEVSHITREKPRTQHKN